MTTEEKKEGWTFLWNATKCHYFRDNRSLCRKWLCLSFEPDEKEIIDSPDNCAECRRRRLKELEEK